MLAASWMSAAQQLAKKPRIGFLLIPSPSPSQNSNHQAFRQGLREHCLLECQNITVEYRRAEVKVERLPDLAAELVRLQVDLIVVSGTQAIQAAKHATNTIPIVMAQDPDPVGNGFVASLARPGGNITGLSRLAPELSGKQLELLKEIVPRLSRVAVLWSSTEPGNAQSLRELELAAGAFGVKLHYLDILDPKDIGTAFQEASKGRADAVLALPSAVFGRHRTEVAGLAGKNRLPVIHFSPEFVEVGGLMSYGVDIRDLYRRAAIYVDKILKGAKPADLPVEQPTKFELVINRKTARALSLTIPQSILLRADQVIE